MGRDHYTPPEVGWHQVQSRVAMIDDAKLEEEVRLRSPRPASLVSSASTVCPRAGAPARPRARAPL